MRPAARDWIECALARAVLMSLSMGPRGASEWLARRYTGLLDFLVPKLRRTSMRNLEMAMPETGPDDRRRIVDGTFRSIARTLVAVARFPSIHSGNVADWIRYDGLEHFHAARARGRGVLFATAHLGNWELSAFAHALLTRPMHVVVRALDNRGLDALARRYRSMSGNFIVEKRDFARSIVRALKDNEAVGILVDQNTSLSEGVFVDFFGIPACVGVSFARLAARTGAAVIPGYAMWSESEGKYILEFQPPLFATGDEREDTQSIQSALERAIRKYPDQWLWMHRRWKTRPPGEPPLY